MTASPPPAPGELRILPVRGIGEIRPRDDLAGTFTDAAGLFELLADQQTTLEDLVDIAPVALDEAEALVADQSANLSCLTDDLTALNELFLGPTTYVGPNEGQYETKLDELDALLARNRSFFQGGFNLIVQPEYATGIYWNRVDLLLTQAGLGQPYPEQRATPPILPGAACESETFGPGVNAVRQADAQPAHESSPGILYAPLVDGARDGDAERIDPPRREVVTGAPAGAPAGTDDRPPLPATGGGLLAVSPLLLGMALWLRGRR